VSNAALRLVTENECNKESSHKKKYNYMVLCGTVSSQYLTIRTRNTAQSKYYA
jgi:hypothetical protein